MLKWLLDLVSWREVRNTYVWSYQVNRRTGARRIIQVGHGYQPVDAAWLNESTC